MRQTDNNKLMALNERRSRSAAKKFTTLVEMEEFRPVLYRFLTETDKGKELSKELFLEKTEETEDGEPMATTSLIYEIERAESFRDASTMALNAPQLWKKFEDEPGGMAILSQIFPEVHP